MSSRSERRREAQGKSTGSGMTKLYLILGAVAVIGVGAVGYSVGGDPCSLWVHSLSPLYPQQVAKVVRFLAGPEAEYITGQVLPVDGGMV